mmetsp:Transcript_54428/g.69963  ORF Transcript_54428/g.69963 Transcript_54428/m.69963 type:complete len:458 (+) Transcript_54428:51-1424(+)
MSFTQIPVDDEKWTHHDSEVSIKTDDNVLDSPLIYHYDDAEQKQEQDEGPESEKASLAASIFNLSNTTLGAGVVSIPYFYSQCGIILGTIILLIISLLAVFCNYLLVNASWETGIWSFGELATKSYGERGTATFQICMLSLTLGVMSAYFVQLGETGSETLNSLLPKHLRHEWYTSELFVKACFTACPIIPFAIQRKLSALANASLLVVLVILYLAFVVCYVSASARTDDGDDDGPIDDLKMAFFGSEFFTALPIVVLAFGNSVNVHEVVVEMKNPTRFRVLTLLISTNLLVSIVYIIIGIAGYSHFRNHTSDNIIINYEGVTGSELGIVSIAEVGLVLVVVCSYPMLLFPCRACLDTVLKTNLSDKMTGQYSENTFFYSETTFIVAFSFLISVIVPVLGEIMGFTGAIAGTFIVFTFPALYHAKLVPMMKYPSISLVIIGILFTVVCLSVEIMSYA